MNFYDALAYFAAGAGGSFGVFQIIRTIRSASTDGISLLSWAMMGANSGFWLCYGIKISSAQQVLGNSPWLVMAFVLGWYLAKEGRVHPAFALAWPALMLVAGTSAMAVSEMLMAPIGVMFNLLIGVPQLRAILRSQNAVGVSVWAWLAAGTGSLCWLVYGLGTSDIPVVVTAIPGAAIQLSVTALVAKRLWDQRVAIEG